MPRQSPRRWQCPACLPGCPRRTKAGTPVRRQGCLRRGARRAHAQCAGLNLLAALRSPNAEDALGELGPAVNLPEEYQVRVALLIMLPSSGMALAPAAAPLPDQWQPSNLPAPLCAALPWRSCLRASALPSFARRGRPWRSGGLRAWVGGSAECAPMHGGKARMLQTEDCCGSLGAGKP